MKNRAYKIFAILIFVLGITIRLFAYLSDRPMWRDECSLALSILFGGFKDYFAPLVHGQSAPVMFMAFTKILANLFGTNEFVLRFIPLVCGILALVVFYFLAKSVFDKKYLVLISISLFAINARLIYYCQEFKQYSCDVLFVLLAIYIFSKLDVSKLNIKNFIPYAALAFVPFMFCFPYVFVLGAFIIYTIFWNRKNANKYFYICCSILALAGILYCIFVLLPSQAQMFQEYGKYWGSGFLKSSFNSVVGLLNINLKFFFTPNTFTLFLAILSVIGFSVSFKSKKPQILLISLTMIAGICASFLHIYPLRERVALWSVPLLIFFILMPFEIINLAKRKIMAFFLCTFLFLGFIKYNPNYLKTFFTPSKYISLQVGLYEYPYELMKIIKQNFNEERGDIIVFNDASDSQFYYFMHKMDLKTNHYIKIKLVVENSKDFYFDTLSKLPKGHTYWFYYPYDYLTKPVVPYLKEWLHLNAKEVFLEKTIGTSNILGARL